MKVKFTVRYDLTPVAGRLVYVAKDYALNFLPSSPSDFRKRRGELGEFTVGIDTLQLVAGVETRQLVSLWGLFPRPGWKPAQIDRPPARPGGVTVELGREPENADYGILGTQDWPRYFDQRSGWVMAGDPSDPATERVEFVQGSILAIRREQPVAIWLHPEFVETLPSGS